MTNFDWMDELTELELANLVEHATQVLIEKDKLIAKEYIKAIRNYCLSIDKLHTNLPVLRPYNEWCDLADDFDELLTDHFYS